MTPQQVGAVPLPTACLEHHRSDGERREGVVRRLVPPEPVVLVGDAGKGPLAGQRERVPVHVLRAPGAVGGFAVNVPSRRGSSFGPYRPEMT